MEPKLSLKLFGTWASPFVQRVHLALKLKGLQYEYIEEDLGNKSPELLQYNPVYKKVPVLLHGERPVVESAIILEYIDEVWKDAYPLLPSDPYERAVVRFWNHFWEDKLGPVMEKIILTAGEEQKAAAKELRGAFQVLEDEVHAGFFKDRRFFGGEQIGFLDIIYGSTPVWVPVLEEIAGVKLMDAETFPIMYAWNRDLKEHEYVRKTTPPEEKLLEYTNAIRVRRNLPDLVAVSSNHK